MGLINLCGYNIYLVFYNPTLVLADFDVACE